MSRSSTPLPRSLIELATTCEATSLPSAAECIVERGLSRRGGYVCLCNVHVLTSTLHDANLGAALADAWKRYPDGAPVAWLRRRISGQHGDRIGGPDLMELVLDLGRLRGLRHYLLGSTPLVLSKLTQRLETRIPGVAIVGSHAPPYGARDFEEALETIRDTDPHIVWCAFGAPKQELWMHEHARSVGTSVFVGVGAAFDFHAEEKARAPRWMRERGLEWIHRLASEPRRLAGRYVKTNSEFVARCAFELARRRLAS